MRPLNWFRKPHTTQAARVARPRRRFRPALEELEGRRLPAVLWVTNTGDSGPGSLRQAIDDSNASVGVHDTISFRIGSGTRTIAPASALPYVTDPVTIDGTAPRDFPKQRIELTGTALSGSGDGLTITAGGSLVRGLVINCFPEAGISLWDNGGNHVEGCYIGTDVTGTAPLGNDTGVEIRASNNVVGGT